MIILLPFAVPYQGKRNQNEEGNRTTSASSRILSCANQVSSTHCSTRKVDRNVTLIFKHLPYIKCNIAHGKIARFSYFQDGLKTIDPMLQVFNYFSYFMLQFTNIFNLIKIEGEL